MKHQDAEKGRQNWAKRNAQFLVDGILGASERSGWPWHPTPDQIALLREIAKRALWHLPEPNEELKELREFFEAENLQQAHSNGDKAVETVAGTTPGKT